MLIENVKVSIGLNRGLLFYYAAIYTCWGINAKNRA